MKFIDHLSKSDIQKFNQLRKAEWNKKEHKPKKSKVNGYHPDFCIIDELHDYPVKPNDKKQENLSQRELIELMGMNRDTYQRRNGAMRRR